MQIRILSAARNEMSFGKRLIEPIEEMCSPFREVFAIFLSRVFFRFSLKNDRLNIKANVLKIIYTSIIFMIHVLFMVRLNMYLPLPIFVFVNNLKIILMKSTLDVGNMFFFIF